VRNLYTKLELAVAFHSRHRTDRRT